jgi:predicted O-linked N-acetylglucosamine transferase (SPINDLY family)
MKKEFEKANELFYNASVSNKNKLQKLKSAIEIYDKIINSADITDYLLLDSNPEIPKNIYLTSMYNTGTCYKTISDDLLQNLSNENILLIEEYYKKGLVYFIKLLKIDFENENALQQLTSIYTKLCFTMQNVDISKSLMYLQEGLLFVPENPTIHYNLGYIYQVMNKLEMSLTHYKLALALNGSNSQNKQANIRLALNCYNGIGCIFRSIKQWPEALHYSLKAHKMDPKDPDINNQLGVVYTEMRKTDLAELCYNKAIQHYKLAFISNNPTNLLSDTYLNLGHMHAYNGNNEKAIESYNKSLETQPNNVLSFQNKIMNLSYCFDSIEDKTYILSQHKLVNKLFKKGNKYNFNEKYFNTPKIKIGIISGDFSEHPVTYFISTFLQKFDSSKFEVTCYSECIIDTEVFNKNLKFKYVKNVSAEKAADMIHNDNIHILLDLAGHTAFNRLDIFALKPCPIQITYIGYPYSTGLTEMDYRITDDVCDNIEVSQKFYTEKLINLPGGILCYDPNVIKTKVNILKSQDIDVPLEESNN